MKSNKILTSLFLFFAFCISSQQGYCFYTSDDFCSSEIVKNSKPVQKIKPTGGIDPATNFAKASAAYNSYFKYFSDKKQFGTAKKYLDSAFVYARKSNSTEALYNALTNGIYYDIVVARNYKDAGAKYKELFRLHTKDSLSLQSSEIYYGYADVLEKLGDFKEANKYLKKCSNISDGAFNQKNGNAIRLMETKYQIAKVENSYKLKQKILEANQNRNKKIAYVFLTLLLLSLILFYFFYQNTVLKQKNKLKDIQIEIKHKVLNATLDGQEMERKKIAAVLHDSISAQLSSAGLHLSAFSAINNIESQEIDKTRAILKETHDGIRALSHELLPALLSKLGLFFAISDLCEKNSNRTIIFNYSSAVSQKKRYKEKYEMKVYFIITELFNNIIKHSLATNVEFDIQEIDNELVVYIRDNGKGFDIDSTKTNEGFGLTQIRARVSSMNGKFIITSSTNKGTSVKIKLPIQE